MKIESQNYWVRVSGRLACWTPPEFRAERISALLPSHDAWVGLMRTILGHKEFRWVIPEVRLLFKPEYFSVTSNEVKFNGIHSLDVYDRPLFVGHHNEPRGGKSAFKFAQQTPRTTMFLRNPDYLLRVRVAGHPEAVLKNEAMFLRRMENGQQWGQPCLGLRELMADVELVQDPKELKPQDITQDCGIIFYGTDWESTGSPQYFTHLQVVNGVAHYPSWEDVRQTGYQRPKAKMVVS